MQCVKQKEQWGFCFAVLFAVSLLCLMEVSKLRQSKRNRSYIMTEEKTNFTLMKSWNVQNH